MTMTENTITSNSPLHVREDIAKNFDDLFGNKNVNHQIVNVENLIAELTSNLQDDFFQIAKARSDFLKQPGDITKKYAFLPNDLTVFDAAGESATVKGIRQGMLDNLLGKKTADSWQLNNHVPIPQEIMRPGLQGTGPFDDLGMAMSAINAETASWMADWEDAGNDYADKLYQAWKNLKELLSGHWENQTYPHPVKKKEYRISPSRESWPILFIRVPGLHLKNRQITLNKQPIPAIIPALVLHTLNNYDSQQAHQSGIYFYIPKIETPQEGLVVAKILTILEDTIHVSRGTIKIEMLNERGRYSANQESIMWVLRHWLVGPNVGRWDYINSRIEMGKDDKHLVFPDPQTVGMTDPTMTAYTRRNALLTLMVNGFPVGGMSAVMKNPRQSKEINDKAVRSIWFDKLRERLTGLFFIEGNLHDTYRQSWVATTENEYVRAGEEPLKAEYTVGEKSSELQEIVNRASDDERNFLEKLDLLENDQIAPTEISVQDLTIENLFSDKAWEDLFEVPQGAITEEGLRYAIYMASEYMFQQLNGNNAAAIDDYLSGTRLMNDFATYEIFWHWLWTTLHHEVELTQNGETTKQGDCVTKKLMHRLLDERREDVTKYFAEQDRQGIVSRFDRSKAPLVMDLLQTQIFHPEWIMYGSRILLSIIESEREQQQIIEAVFSMKREELVDKVETGELSKTVLSSYDYVYDTSKFTNHNL